MQIKAYDTPNNNAKKFVVIDLKQTISIPVFFKDVKKAYNKNEIAYLILSINGIESVYMFNNFITVNKLEGVSWIDIEENIKDIINNFYKKHGVLDQKNEKTTEEVHNKQPEENMIDQTSDSELVNKIKKIIDVYIRPNVLRDGGNVIFKSYKDGEVVIALEGACVGCPSANITLQYGVKRTLQYYIPEVISVICKELE